MKSFFYTLWQCSWGAAQTALGLALFFSHRRCRHFRYHGAIVTLWPDTSSISLGLFVFVSETPFFTEKYQGVYTPQQLFRRLLVHEYGHTIQSLLLGPLYLLLIGIPSTCWGVLGAPRRKARQIPYCAFFTESWANRLGEAVTKEPSLGQLVLEQ